MEELTITARRLGMTVNNSSTASTCLLAKEKEKRREWLKKKTLFLKGYELKNSIEDYSEALNQISVQTKVEFKVVNDNFELVVEDFDNGDSIG
ncbi:hypothetical protein Scep_012423 [Stephania cephalantha]|uniref:Uncharacterized protein n=1 Tax=Stephania cephalantha TaxID=152367 RepID=A0AAP0P9I4_9MAGN